MSLIKSKICKALNNNGPSGDRVTIEGNSERFHTIHKAGKLEAGEGDTATQMSASAWRRKKIVSHNIKEKTSNWVKIKHEQYAMSYKNKYETNYELKMVYNIFW